MSRLRKSLVFKSLAIFMVVCLLNEIVFPIYSFGLTGGPSQPEMQSFEPVGTSQMVDLSTGDFNYNIPLLDVGGYPVNIAYHAGGSMDEEASWVGYGWNINPGVINRNVRGIPDDFNGEKIESEYSIKPNKTIGFSFKPGAEMFGKHLGWADLKLNLGVFYNNYKGVGFEYSASPGFSKAQLGNLTASMSFGTNSQEGTTISPKLSFEALVKEKKDELQQGLSFTLGSSYSSRSGVQSLNFGMSATNTNRYSHPTKKDKKNEARKGSVSSSNSVSGTFNFNSPTYVPNITNSQRNFHLSLNASIGSSASGLYPKMEFNGYFSSQWIKEIKSAKRAFGYCYQQNTNDEDVLLDFNREKDGAFSENTTNLPITNHTYDVFAASGQGISGSFRAFRSDISVVHSDVSNTTSGGGSLGGEFGVGAFAHFGANVNANWNNGETGEWRENNELRNMLGHLGQSYSKVLYEHFYFKSAGENTKMDSRYYSSMAKDTTVSPFLSYNYLNANLYKKTPEYLPNEMYQTYYKHAKRLSTKENNTRANRESRNTLMSVLNSKESTVAGHDKYITNYLPNWSYGEIDGLLAIEGIDRSTHPDHHFSEVTMLNNEGARYVYGIPAYNNLEKELSFNVRGRSKDCSIGQVTYGGVETSTPDNTSANQRGNDHFFSSKTTPPYAHSYLLTAYLSPDYVDLHDDGITDDDLGTAVKFNYTRVHDSYRWRVPYNENSANFQEGIKSTEDDDKGSYIYGEKEIWNMHSIETKTQIAFFVTSDRNDGLGVEDENGGINSEMKLKKLDKIILYEKQDFIRNGSNAVPIKTVHFEYDYSLCDGIDNSLNDEGKLTLKKLFFTYGNSNKGVLSAYEFSYGSSGSTNPNYNLKGSDCWGSYKPNASTGCSYNSSEVSNMIFPYTSQDSTTAALHASAWALSQIKLPSGGTINITYEADDYAYVQDKHAMQLFQVKGFGNDSGIGTYNNKIYEDAGLFNINHKELVYFKLKNPITGSNTPQQLFDQYLKNIKDVQYSVLAQMDKDDETNGNEYVKGYLELDLTKGYGVVESGTVGYVGLKFVKIGDKHPGHKDRLVNPIARSCWNFARLNLPHLVYPFSNNDNGDMKIQLFGLMPLMTDLRYMISGFNKTLESKKFGQSIKCEHSWIRFNVPDKKKKGGGHRVKQITTSDNWATIGASNTGASDFEYGQEYHYLKLEQQENGRVIQISSGVASYEPMIGGDENPFRLPRVTVTENKLAPNTSYLTEEPIGESFFPSACVIYSSVTVNALRHEGVKRTATGYSVSEFYTAKDFPTIIDETNLFKHSQEPEPFWSMFSISKITSAKAVQGYKVILNDMHGKPKSEFTYSEESTVPIAGKIYKYKSKIVNGKTQLDNTVLTINDKGVISSNEIAVEADMVVDSRKATNHSYSVGGQYNTDLLPALVVPFPVLCIFPSYHQEKLDFRSAVTTKVIKKYGLLDSTIVIKNGATLTSQNLLYDEETGEILLTKTQNEFNDFNYSYTYPAYWGHPGMGPAYRNNGAIIKNISINSYGDISTSSSIDLKDYLFPGDECLVFANDGEGKILKAYIYDGDDGLLNLIDNQGDPIYPGAGKYENNPGNGPYWIKVIRSAYRNMTAADMGTVTTRTNPLVLSGGTYSLSFTNVLETSAMRYKDDWQTYVPYLNEYQCLPNQVSLDYFNIAKCIYSKSKSSLKVIYTLNSSVSGDSLYIKSGPTWNGYETPVNIDLSDDLNCDSIFIVKDAPGIKQKVDLYNKRDLDSYKLSVGDYSNSFVCFANNPVPCNGNFCTNLFYGSELKRVMDSLGNSSIDTTVLSGSNSFFNQYIFYSTYNIIGNKINIKTGMDNNANHIPCMLEFSLEAENFVNIDTLLSCEPMGKNSAILNMRIRKLCNVFDTIDVVAQFPCFNMFNCSYSCYSAFTERSVNPYRSGLEGNWRPYKNYTYLEDRQYSTPLNIRTDGTFQSYTPFWTYNSTTKKYEPSSNSKWVWASEITKYTPFGNEVENKDALERYSAAIFGYSHTLPKAVASNSKYGQIGYDGFEDYSYMNPFNTSICEVDHWSFNQMFNPTLANAILDNQIKHTGKYSLKVYQDKSVEVSRNIILDNFDELSFDYDRTRTIQEDDDIGLFKPDPGKYIISAWVKENVPANDTLFNDAHIEVVLYDISNNPTTHTFYAKGKVIEGWQRIEGVFTFTSGQNIKSIKVKLVGADEVDSWFDDVRIHPFDGNMKSFAYDARTLKLMAELDENNYATFYEYDSEGVLIRVKKETINGIVTLKENRNHYHKPVN